ncbi:MAG: hypothetical protein U9Q98_10465 [Bacteroidota bacterium]|nr:hypothetical protein [Bacteroidota bacterium]
MENQIILYQAEDESTSLEVRVENETVWLTQAQMAKLFQTTSQPSAKRRLFLQRTDI